ncbi:hypothetical protein OUZ56_011870 [Daphnia magna]|uniref:Uncharacterized protein n=1 Tax=Daphnia magna TaxID=35525 RepID=A0ABQ9Z1D7_9CRUS|nr:hypothetical protein OUZ56_011870 [Daphnia magna]
MRVEPSYKGINARALLFFDDHDYLQSMLIICGTARNFKNIPVTKSWQAVFKLLSVYYVFDGNYPALYGVLSVIERRCISQLLNTSITVDPKDSSSLKVFIQMEELYAALVYRDQLDFEIVPANQVPQSMLESPGRCGYIPSMPGVRYRFLGVGTNQNELRMMPLNVLVDEVEYMFGFNPQPHRTRNRG